MSQMELGLAANVSSRHIAFLETGRARPSRQMVLQLGEALEAPRTERNRMLDSAGFRPAFVARSMSDVQMAPVRSAIMRVMQRHDPWPAVVVDRHWNLVDANPGGKRLLAAFGLAKGSSLLDALTDNGNVRGMIENWPEVATHMLARLRTESTHLGGDPVLDAAVKRLAADPELAKVSQTGDMPPFVPARYCLSGQIYSVFTTIAQFGTAEDIALADLRIELFFPADAATQALFDALA